jgi:hypothetical protein
MEVSDSTSPRPYQYPYREFAEQRSRALRDRERVRRSRPGFRERRQLIAIAKRDALICERCGERTSGTVECLACRVYTATYQQARYHARREAGLCVDCGKPADAGSKCRFHADRRNRRRKFFGRGPGG